MWAGPAERPAELLPCTPWEPPPAPSQWQAAGTPRLRPARPSVPPPPPPDPHAPISGSDTPRCMPTSYGPWPPRPRHPMSALGTGLRKGPVCSNVPTRGSPLYGVPLMTSAPRQWRAGPLDSAAQCEGASGPPLQQRQHARGHALLARCATQRLWAAHVMRPCGRGGPKRSTGAVLGQPMPNAQTCVELGDTATAPGANAGTHLHLSLLRGLVKWVKMRVCPTG